MNIFHGIKYTSTYIMCRTQRVAWWDTFRFFGHFDGKRFNGVLGGVVVVLLLQCSPVGTQR